MAVTLNAVPEPVVVMLPVPKVITRVLVLAELNKPLERVLLAKFSVPLVKVYVAVVEAVKLPDSSTVPPTPFWVIENNVLLAEVIVCVPEVAANVHKPEPVVKVIPATNVSEP